VLLRDQIITSGGKFFDCCHNIAVVMRAFHGGPWQLLFASRDASSEHKW